ncbi:MAG: hypothetical protein KatS3mg102_1754 [Planctomycetota bacterium]|nr:MAG: hypothetical protein KatS3mg102_1754 [Planctomycetota bacterium]
MRPLRAPPALRLGAVLAALAGSAAAGALAAPQGPPYYDPNRGIQRQQEAAKQARAEVRPGTAEAIAKAFRTPR